MNFDVDSRDKGLCCTCDAMFLPGHKCKSRFFLLVHQDEDCDLTSQNIYGLLHVLHCPSPSSESEQPIQYPSNT